VRTVALAPRGAALGKTLGFALILVGIAVAVVFARVTYYAAVFAILLRFMQEDWTYTIEYGLVTFLGVVTALAGACILWRKAPPAPED
jgi:hypothetical protein